MLFFTSSSVHRRIFLLLTLSSAQYSRIVLNRPMNFSTTSVITASHSTSSYTIRQRSLPRTSQINRAMLLHGVVIMRICSCHATLYTRIYSSAYLCIYWKINAGTKDWVEHWGKPVSLQIAPSVNSAACQIMFTNCKNVHLGTQAVAAETGKGQGAMPPLFKSTHLPPPTFCLWKASVHR